MFVIEQILANLQEAYETATGYECPFVFGEEALHAHENTSYDRCIVFTHRGGEHESPDQVKGYQEEARTTAKPLSWAVEMLRAECRAPNNEAADTLWRDLCVLLMNTDDNEGRMVRDLYLIKLGRFGWLSEDPNRASPMLGLKAKWQDLSLTTSVPNALSSTVSLLTTGHEGYLISTATDEGCQCEDP